MSRAGWQDVSRRAPCPICRRDHWCSRSADGVWVCCRRVDDGTGTPKLDKLGDPYWLYKLIDPVKPGAGDPVPPPIVVGNDRADPAIAAIMKAAKTGKIGDGKIFVTTVDDSIRIRTDERGEKAL